ncbi:hypothetical protein [Nitrosopumilus sp.]|uniref:hypothetical protein n=1 Tax=Nitrosopumilus sp. TaxID=2024843 RepID=UPI003D0B71F4
MKPYIVIENFKESEFLNLKGKIKERTNWKDKPLQKGTKESLQFETPDGKITVTYYNNSKLMIQGSPNNPEFEWLYTEISEYSTNRTIGKI